VIKSVNQRLDGECQAGRLTATVAKLKASRLFFCPKGIYKRRTAYLHINPFTGDIEFKGGW